MAELNTVIYCVSLCPYQSLYVFIVMAGLLDFPVVKNARLLIWANQSSVKTWDSEGQQTGCQDSYNYNYVRTLVRVSAWRCWLRLCPLCANRPVVTCLADSRVLRKAHCKILTRNWGRFAFCYVLRLHFVTHNTRHSKTALFSLSLSVPSGNSG